MSFLIFSLPNFQVLASMPAFTKELGAKIRKEEYKLLLLQSIWNYG
jgi:hypothetical protein